MSFININNSKIYYQEYGSGSPIVFIHGGMGLSCDYFKNQSLNLLVQNGFRVILYDQRGHGRSEKDLSRETYTNKQLANDLVELIKKLELTNDFTVLGHSYGGFILLEAVLKNSKIFDKIVLCSTGCGPYESDPTFEDKDDFEENFRQGWRDLFTSYDEDYTQIFESMKLSMHAYNTFAEREIRKFNVSDKISEISKDTLIICGSEDENYLDSSRKINERISNSTLEIIQNCSHFPFIENPKKFVKLLTDWN